MCVQVLGGFLPACAESRKNSCVMSRVESLLHRSGSWLLSCDIMTDVVLFQSEFVFNSVYVDLKYNEIYFTVTAGYVCSHVVVLGLSLKNGKSGPHCWEREVSI